MNKALLTNIAVGAGGVAVGGFAGFLVAKKALEKKYRELADAEIESVRKAYHEELEKFREVPQNQKFASPQEAADALYNKPEILTPEEAEKFNAERIEDGRKLVETLADLEYVEEPKEPAKSYNIWDGPGVSNPEGLEEPASEDDEEWPGEPDEFTTLDGPEVTQSADVPYVIGSETYYAEADGYTKLILGYYEEDGVLADERERIVNDIEGTVGQANLNQFGFLSGDKDVVLIRNERTRTDFEVHREDGSYTEIILKKQVPAERKPKPGRMRDNE